jgi:hypothetical protein
LPCGVYGDGHYTGVFGLGDYWGVVGATVGNVRPGVQAEAHGADVPALRAINFGDPKAPWAELAGPNGALYLESGHATRYYGDKVACFEPIAYGKVSISGSVYADTGNFTVSWVAASSRYEIAIDDVSFVFDRFAVTVTSDYYPYVAVTDSANGKLLVKFYDTSTSTYKQNWFSFVVLQPDATTSFKAPQHGYDSDKDWMVREPEAAAAWMRANAPQVVRPYGGRPESAVRRVERRP